MSHRLLPLLCLPARTPKISVFDPGSRDSGDRPGSGRSGLSGSQNALTGYVALTSRLTQARPQPPSGRLGSRRHRPSSSSPPRRAIRVAGTSYRFIHPAPGASAAAPPYCDSFIHSFIQLTEQPLQAAVKRRRDSAGARQCQQEHTFSSRSQCGCAAVLRFIHSFIHSAPGAAPAGSCRTPSGLGGGSAVSAGAHQIKFTPSRDPPRAHRVARPASSRLALRCEGEGRRNQ